MASTLRSALALLPVTALALACGDSGSTGEGADSGSESGDEAGTTDSGESGDAGTDTSTDTGTDTGGEDPSAICAELELPSSPLLETSGASWGELAGSFAVETTFGPWDLAQEYSGCESYVFVNHIGDGQSDSLRGSFGPELFERSPKNVHYFFLNNEADPEAGALVWQDAIGLALAPLDDATTQEWVDRVHFVTDPPATIAGGVGEFFAANPNARLAAIDRFGRWDDPNLVQSGSNLAYTPRWYNHRHAVELELAAEDESGDITEVVLMDAVEFPPDGPPGQDGPFANNFNNQVWSAEFPDAATMAGFDTMEVVVTAWCGPDAGADCGHWDYEAFVHWCDSQACDGERREVFRWITPYARAGERKWVFEASPMLAMVREGGTQHFQFGMRWNMNPSTWDMRFRLSNSGGPGAAEAVPAFIGNKGFNDGYNDWPTVEFTPPADAARVELVALISGHGQATGNCAEWCNHQHEFTVNGEAVHLRSFPNQVADLRCAEMADFGVVPGQWGNWTPGRAGWCPGLPVVPWVVDITAEVELGALNTLDYQGLFGGAPVTGDRGRILLSSYLVYYE
jgi:hypothetical protein